MYGYAHFIGNLLIGVICFQLTHTDLLLLRRQHLDTSVEQFMFSRISIFSQYPPHQIN